MKAAITKQLLFFLLILIGSDVFAQQNQDISFRESMLFEWTEMPVFISRFNTAIATADSGWILGGQNNNPLSFISWPTLIKLSNQGEKIWEHVPMEKNWEVGNTDALLQLPSGDILSAGSCIMGCDYGPPGIFVEQSTGDGEILWQTRIVADAFDTKVLNIFQIPYEEILVISTECLYKFSTTGDSLSTQCYDVSSLNRISCAFADTSQILLGINTDLLVTDLDGSITDTIGFPNKLRNIYSFEGNHFIYTDSALLKLNSQFQIADSLYLGEIHTSDDLTIFNDSTFLLATSDEFATVDLLSFLLNTTTYTKPEKLKPASLAIRDSLLLFAGSSNSGYWNYAFAAKTWKFRDGTTADFTEDIGVSNIRIENIRSEKEPDYEVYHFYWDAYATVTNYGDVPVSYFNLASKLIYPGICGFLCYFKPFEEETIQPGDSIEVFFGPMADYGFYLPDLTEYTYTLKVHTMIPNLKIDRDLNNDEIEESFTIRLVGLEENQKSKLVVYPNPVRGVLTLQSDSPIYNWQLLSVAGTEIKSGSCNSVKLGIDVSSLNSGLYFLQTENENGHRIFQKIVVK